jgi:polysaccharide transporter, PST family
MSRSLSLNTISVITARLGVPCLSFLLVAALARVGGAELLGQYTLLVTLFILAENLKSCGLTTLLTREIAGSLDIGKRYYPSLVRVGLLGSVPAALVMLGLLAAAKTPEHVLVAGCILSVALIPSSFALAGDAVFLGLGRAHWSTVLTLSESFARLVTSFLLVVVFRRGLISLALAYCVTRTVAAAVQHNLLRRVIKGLPDHNWAITRGMLAGAGPFFVVFAAPLLLFKLDVVFIGALRDQTAVGIYSAAMRLTAIWFVIPDGLMTATLVRLAQLFVAKRKDDFRLLVERTIRFVNILMIPAGTVMSLGGRAILGRVFGNKLMSAWPLLDILSWTIVPYAMCRTLGDTLVAANLQAVLARIIVVSLAVSIGVYLLFIGIAAETGAAWAFLFSTLTLCCLTAWQVIGKQQTISFAAFCQGLGPSLLGLIATLAYRRGYVAAAVAMFVCAGLIVANAVRVEWRLFRQRSRPELSPALSQLTLESVK